ncbi:MAG: extracellular solute-binding protein [Clostridia bacterium]|nr:extracellular solute-binding protein [Clostridia bacterium]
MKKTLCILLAVLMIIGLFSGCAGEPDPLRICVDVDAVNYQRTCDSTVQEFVEALGMLGGPTDVELDIIPAEASARGSAIQRIRTEIMSGQGPDVFIVLCSAGLNGCESLFPIPEKIMENNLFLPLDEYMEDAQFTDWNKQIKAVMEAGRNEYGQQIIPLTYTMPITFYRASDVSEKPGKETTWQDMLSDETGVLATAGTWYHMDENVSALYTGAYLEYILGNLADYENEELLFTEEELYQRTTEVLELKEAYEDGQYADVPTHFQTRMRIGYQNIEPDDWTKDVCRGIYHHEPQTMIPIYSDDGGVTATIMSFAAVNANTKRPEDAFFAVDYLMSTSYQRYSELYAHWLTGMDAIPMQTDLLQEDPDFNEFSVERWYLKQENYEEFVRVREQITHARFNGGLDEGFGMMMFECRKARDQGEDYAPIVAECYNTLKQMIAE